MRGIPSHTISQGELVFAQGDLRAVQGKEPLPQAPGLWRWFCSGKTARRSTGADAVLR